MSRGLAPAVRMGPPAAPAAVMTPPPAPARSPSPQPSCSSWSAFASAVRSTPSGLDAGTFNVCPATGWQCMEDVVRAANSVFDGRCNVCNTCEKVNKLITITTFVIKQKKIDFTDETGSGESILERFLISEMLPVHTHMMLKITIVDCPTKLYNACLIPRTDKIAKQDLLFGDKKYILDHVLEKLSLTLGESPSSLVRPVSPVAGRSRLTTRAPPFDPSLHKRDQGVDPQLLDAPVFRPTHEEFADPITYVIKIWDQVVQYGICKIIPPGCFTPPCKCEDEMKVDTRYQYISRLYSRWGPAAREASAIKASLPVPSTLDNVENQFPLIDGVEVSLPKLYHIVQRHGGLQNVIDQNKWGKVAEDMRLSKAGASKLEGLYLKHVLAYDTLSADERQELLLAVEETWNSRHHKLLARARNPLKRLIDGTLFKDEDPLPEENWELPKIVRQAENCSKNGPSTHWGEFKKASVTRSKSRAMYLPLGISLGIQLAEGCRTPD